jgi:hypothetical protein
VTDLAVEYIELGLRLGRHVDDLVDSYYGPAEISERVNAEELRAPAALVEDAVQLREANDDAYLDAQLLGLETVARKLAGEEFSYEDEVERCYGIRPRRTPESQLEEVHRKLDAALPGSGSLAERYQAWRERDPIPPEHLAKVIEGIAAEVRSRTADLVGLPPGESVEWCYVTDEPWSAYNHYQGGLRSRIDVNTETALIPTFVVHLVAHETYPGHHTEHVWKEYLFVRGQAKLEESILLIATPSSMISEGIGELALGMALGQDEQELTAKLVAGTGTPYDPDVSREVQEATESLSVMGNVALMLHSEGRSTDEAKEYLMHWALVSEPRAEFALRFVTDPMWRTYATTYADGYALCKEYVDGDPARFKRLLTEQVAPADLR